MKRERLTVLDALRGISVIAMIVYHTMWDLVYIHGVDIPWFFTGGASVFQAYIRWSFIIISGFSWSLGKRKLRRSLLVITASLVITAFTCIAMPADKIVFGVLWFLGVAMLIMIPASALLRRVEPHAGLALSALLFYLSYGIPHGSVGLFGTAYTVALPEGLYANYFTSALGFVCDSFYSSDYVPIFPWIFLFLCGYFLYGIFKKHNIMGTLRAFSVKPLEWVGRNALWIYMIHQPAVYGILYLIFNFLLKK